MTQPGLKREVGCTKMGNLKTDNASDIEDGEIPETVPPKYIDPCEKIRKRKAELERQFGSTISKFNRMCLPSENITEKQAAERHAARRRARRVSESGSSELREQSRRAVAAMQKTVEIADGSGDFGLLMVAAFGKGYARYWTYSKDVFEDSTGLRLIHETDEE